MKKESFFVSSKGENVSLYTLVNKNGVQVKITDMGGAIVNLLVPDKNGNMTDIVLGHHDPKEYEPNGPFFGALIGRVANRITGGTFTLDGKKYQLILNEPDKGNTLHGGDSYGRRMWKATPIGDNVLTLSIVSPDGDAGFPGKVEAVATYTLTDDNALKIDYRATTDKTTVVNLTNHAYFNLNGESDGSILDNVVQINADAFLPMNETFLTTGAVRKVDGTPFDFREPKTIGRDIEMDDVDLKIADGYDHNYCLKDEHFATAWSTKTGIKMDSYTDMPGAQFYVGNNLTGREGKSVYPRRSGFCFETQFYPDAIHKLDRGWKSPILKKGEEFYSKTEYEFSVRK